MLGNKGVIFILLTVLNFSLFTKSFVREFENKHYVCRI